MSGHIISPDSVDSRIDIRGGFEIFGILAVILINSIAPAELRIECEETERQFLFTAIVDDDPGRKKYLIFSIYTFNPITHIADHGVRT